MALPLESVPNFSEGRDRATIAALSDAIEEHAHLLDVHADADHNRSVFTLLGDEAALQEGLVAAVAVACERIDLRRHDGAHPRVGAADVVPIVPLRPDDMARATRTARLLAKRLTAQVGVTTFLYGEVGEGRGPAFFRRGGLEGLQRRLDAGDVAPAYGSPALDPSAGATLVGARGPLVAFNVDLQGASVGVAREVAAAVRESGGGFPGVRALGLELPGSGRVQVSMNVERPESVSLHEVVARVALEARARGAEAGRAELVGLLPGGVAARAAAAALRVDGLDAAHVLESRVLQAL